MAPRVGSYVTQEDQGALQARCPSMAAHVLSYGEPTGWVGGQMQPSSGQNSQGTGRNEGEEER